jgi:hypothetical protein
MLFEQFFGESMIGGPGGASGILERLASVALVNLNQRHTQRLSTICSFNGLGALHRHAQGHDEVTTVPNFTPS